MSEHCTRYLRSGGILLVHNSHGDASLASLDPCYELLGVITGRGGRYRARTAPLAEYLVPKRGFPPTAGELRRSKRGIAYTHAPYAYLFRRAARAGAPAGRPRLEPRAPMGNTQADGRRP